MNFDLDQFFSQFNSEESYAILFFMIVSFLFGLLVGILSRAGKIRRLRGEVEERKARIAELETQLESLNEKLSATEEDLRKRTFELEEERSAGEQLAEDKTKLYSEIYRINSELEKLQASKKSYLSTIEDLNDQILGLKTKNEQLSRQVEESEEEEMEEAVLEVSNDRLRLLEQKMSRLESQNEHLGRELRSMKEKWPTGAAYTGQEEVPETIQPLERQKDIFQEKIVEPPPERDDLTVIEGIGPFLERKLNEQGIFNLEQIAEWKSAEITQVAREIQFFESRILEDNWVGQAQRLLRLKERTPDALPIKLDASFNPQDLQIIEGIGPKIEGLLKDAGIDTWEELAETDSDRLREILSAAGDRYRMHDPSTWPTQARLAANEDWKLLQEYQEQLKGGREIWEEE